MAKLGLERITEWQNEVHLHSEMTMLTLKFWERIILGSLLVKISIFFYPYGFISTIMEHKQAVKSYCFEEKSGLYNKMCRLCFFNAWHTVSRRFFNLVLCAHTEYQNKTFSGKFNKVSSFFKKTTFTERCMLVLTF